MPDYDPRIKGDKKVNKQLFWGINWLFIKAFGRLIIHIIKNKSLKRHGMDKMTPIVTNKKKETKKVNK